MRNIIKHISPDNHVWLKEVQIVLQDSYLISDIEAINSEIVHFYIAIFLAKISLKDLGKTIFPFDPFAEGKRISNYNDPKSAWLFGTKLIVSEPIRIHFIFYLVIFIKISTIVGRILSEPN